MKRLNWKKKLTVDKEQSIVNLSIEFKQQRLKKSLLDAVTTSEIGINTDDDMQLIDQMVTKFNKSFFQTDIQV